MKIALLLPIFVTIAHLHAGDPKPPMTRIEYRNISPKIQPDSFAAKPKILYIAGTTYSRTEEQPDPPLGIHGLIVVAEPHIWMVNLIPRVAQHIVDPGPTFNTHHNILEPNAPKEFSTFEFGKEVEFFQNHHATPIEPQSLDGQRCEASEFRHANYRIVLFTKAETQQPFHLDIFRDDEPYFSIRYLRYETNLSFASELFKPPTDVKIVEVKPSDSK